MSAQARSRPRLLAIDDTPENLIVLASALGSEYEFQLAGSGLEGIALAEKSPPDLILLDVMMPGIDGFETCARLKAIPELAEIPVIFITALTDMNSEIRGLSVGGVDYITKPIQVQLVRHRVANILKLTQLSRALRASEERLRLVMEATGEGVWDWQIARGDVEHNGMWCRMLGLNDSFLVHPVSVYFERVHPEDLPGVQENLQQAQAGDGHFLSEYRMRHEDGGYIWVADRGQVVERDARGQALRMVGSMRNIDERKRNEAEIQRLAYFDTLTDLANRRLLTDRLQHAILKNQRHHTLGAVMFLDMDQFKQLNDQHGHAMGDRLLIEVANRLRQCVRELDTVSRLGGDEFIVMLEDLVADPEAALDDATMVGRKILECLNEPYQLGELVYRSTPSIGLTLFRGKDDTVDSVLKRADLAMYQAKAAGRNTLRIS